jgi:predicted nuclease with TOPRIM domain
MEAKFADAIKNLEDRFGQSLTDLERRLNAKIDSQFNHLQGMIEKDDGTLNELAERVSACEDEVQTNAKKVHLTRESLQHVANSYASFGKSRAVLDNTLPDTLKVSEDYINDTFARIFDEMDKLRDRQQMAAIIERSRPPEQPPQIVVPLVQTATSPRITPTAQIATSPRDIPQIQPAAPSPPPVQVAPTPKAPVQVVKEVPRTIEKRTVIVQQTSSEPAINFGELRPYPPVTAHWTETPTLPLITQFTGFPDLIDYIYRLVPKLQGHLNAMHGKLVKMNEDMLSKMDRGLVEKMFDQFQQVVHDIKTRVDDLKDALEQTATREEINRILEDLVNSLNMESETAIGTVKCIACGRDITKVTGSMTETEVDRVLGHAPYAIAQHVNPVRVSYSGQEGFDSAITESPRSVRRAGGFVLKQKLKI